MHKERFYIGIVVIVSVMALALFAAYVASDRHRADAVEDLRAKTSFIEQRIIMPASDTVTPAETTSRDTSFPTGASSEAGGDAISAYKQFVEAKEEADADPQWADALELIGNGKWSEWTDAEREKVAAYLKANRKLILELRRLADRSEPLYILDYGKGFSMELSHLARFRDYARLLAADTALAAARGDYEEVVRNYAAIKNFADMLTNEPILISQLVRVAMMDILYNSTVQTLTGEDLSPEALQHIIGFTMSAGGRDGLADSLASEGYFGLEAFDGLRAGDFDRAGLSPQGMDAFLMRLYGSVLARPLLNMDEETYARSIAEMSDTVALPMYEAKPLLDQILAEIDSLPRTRVMSHILLPALTRVAEAQARHEARMGLMQLGLAVEHYHGRHGAYPDTLDQVAPLLGGVMPTDPYTGQPFVYEPRRNGFTLYSARGNLYAPTGSLHALYADTQGNIVWRDAGR